MKSCLDCYFLFGDPKMHSGWFGCGKELFPDTLSPSLTLFDLAETCSEFCSWEKL